MILPTDQPIISKDPRVPPAAQVTNPSSGKLENIYRNIDNEPLIKQIKELEVRYDELENVQSMERDEVEMEEQQGSTNADISINKENERQLLSSLLDKFTKLLKSPYGPIGYLVSTDSESIIKLYGVDTDEDYTDMVEGNRIRVSSQVLEKAIAAGGGRRFIGERGLILDNPAQTPANAKLSANAIGEIIQSIKRKLAK